MDMYTYDSLHSAADRLALEAARRLPAPLDESARYMSTYEEVLAFLISKYKEHFETACTVPDTDVTTT